MCNAELPMKDLRYWLVQMVFGAVLIGIVCLIWPAACSRSLVALCGVGWFVSAFYHWLRYGPALRRFFWRGPPPLYTWLMARRTR